MADTHDDPDLLDPTTDSNLTVALALAGLDL